MAHTKGPWFSGVDGERIGPNYRDESGRFLEANMTKNGWLKVVCKITNHKWMAPGESESNARLIAAAPELLESLIQCREALRDNLSKYTYKNEPIMLAAFNDAQRVIAKAEGTSRPDATEVHHG